MRSQNPPKISRSPNLAFCHYSPSPSPPSLWTACWDQPSSGLLVSLPASIFYDSKSLAGTFFNRICHALTWFIAKMVVAGVSHSVSVVHLMHASYFPPSCTHSPSYSTAHRPLAFTLRAALTIHVGLTNQRYLSFNGRSDVTPKLVKLFDNLSSGLHPSTPHSRYSDVRSRRRNHYSFFVSLLSFRRLGSLYVNFPPHPCWRVFDLEVRCEGVT